MWPAPSPPPPRLLTEVAAPHRAARRLRAPFFFSKTNPTSPSRNEVLHLRAGPRDRPSLRTVAYTRTHLSLPARSRYSVFLFLFLDFYEFVRGHADDDARGMISDGPEFSPFLSAGALICQAQPTRPPPSLHVVTAPVCARHLLRACPVPLALCSQGPTERSLQKQLWCSLPQRPHSAAGGKGTCLGWVPQALPAGRALHCALGTAPPLGRALPRGFSAVSFPTCPTSPGTVSQTVKTKRCPPPLRSWRLARGLAHGGSAWVGEREGEPSVRLCPLGSQPSSQGHCAVS